MTQPINRQDLAAQAEFDRLVEEARAEEAEAARPDRDRDLDPARIRTYHSDRLGTVTIPEE